MSVVGPDSNKKLLFQHRCALLEPDALEAPQLDAFTYAVTAGAGNEKIVTASFATDLVGTTGRWEVRNPENPVCIQGVSLRGLGSGSTAVILNPNTVTYTDPESLFYQRQATILTGITPKVIELSGSPSTVSPFLCGTYGAIILQATNFDYTWVIIRPGYGNAGNYGWNLGDEIGDGVTSATVGDYQRKTCKPGVGYGVQGMAVSRLVAAEFETGIERSAGTGRGTIAYILLPSTWSRVTDATVYIFREDCTSATLDTTTVWTRVTTGGTQQIDTAQGWIKFTGDGTWGHSGIYTQANFTRAANREYRMFVNICRDVGGVHPGVLVGCVDDGTPSANISNYAHGLLFNYGANTLKVYEDNNDRGVVGSGYANGTTYEVSITPASGGAGAVYKIRGGAYGALNGAWTTITPGVTSSAKNTFRAGAACGTTAGPVAYVGDIRVI